MAEPQSKSTTETTTVTAPTTTTAATSTTTTVPAVTSPATTAEVVKTMKALILKDAKSSAEFQDIAIPVPKDGEVLIKIESAPINPSDLAFLKGHYQSDKPFPCVPGFEGSGTVVSNGGGLMGWNLVGKRVAVYSDTQWGTYAEFCTADSKSVIPLPDEVDFNEGASTLVNPLTAIALLDLIEDTKVKTVVHSAAASALGRMMVRYFKENGINIINVVRRAEQVELLKKEGAEIVLNQTDADFEEKLKAQTTLLNATIFLDAVGGELTGNVLRNMPKGSTAYVYGSLSQQGSVVDATELIFRRQTVKGFSLSDWIEDKNVISLYFTINKIKGLLKSQLKTEVQQESTLEKFHQAVEIYTNSMTKGKVLLKPQLRSLPDVPLVTQVLNAGSQLLSSATNFVTSSANQLVQATQSPAPGTSVPEQVTAPAQVQQNPK